MKSSSRSLLFHEIAQAYLRDYLIADKVRTLEAKLQSVMAMIEGDYKKLSSEGRGRSFPESSYESHRVSELRHEDPVFVKWQDAVAYFNEIKGKLLKDSTYRGKFVAIKDERLIDSDVDKLQLARRIDSAYPNDVVLVVKVEVSDRVVRIPGPKIII